jgi:RNA polymerase sigma-70 factor (ECF subfamily)
MAMAIPLADEFDADEPLIDAIRAGDRFAFRELVHREGRWVRGVVFGLLGNRECVDDVCQQIWSTAWQRLPSVREAKTWRAWLYRLARNSAIDAGRQASRRRSHAQRMTGGLRPDYGNAPSDPVVEAERQDRVLSAIQGLPAIYREPFVLRHLNDWSYQQIADLMGLPVDSVETRLVRARRLLREALAREAG